MSLPVALLCFLDLGVVAVLPRVFFRPGRLNLRWWATAAPFIAAAATVAAGAVGAIRATLPPSVALECLAVALCAASLALIGFTLGTHREPLSLWHQDDDAPARLVTHGAYARVRHPFYAAFLLGLVGCAAAFPHWGTAAALVYGWARLDRTAAREERRLLASNFGAEYREYLRRTGRFLPRLSG